MKNITRIFLIPIYLFCYFIIVVTAFIRNIVMFDILDNVRRTVLGDSSDVVRTMASLGLRLYQKTDPKVDFAVLLENKKAKTSLLFQAGTVATLCEWQMTKVTLVKVEKSGVWHHRRMYPRLKKSLRCLEDHHHYVLIPSKEITDSKQKVFVPLGCSQYQNIVSSIISWLLTDNSLMFHSY